MKYKFVAQEIAEKVDAEHDDHDVEPRQDGHPYYSTHQNIDFFRVNEHTLSNCDMTSLLQIILMIAAIVAYGFSSWTASLRP